MVVEEPLDVWCHSAHHGLHGWTGSEALSQRLSFDTLGQLTDSTDLQKQKSVRLFEGRNSGSLVSWDWQTLENTIRIYCSM